MAPGSLRPGRARPRSALVNGEVDALQRIPSSRKWLGAAELSPPAALISHAVFTRPDIFPGKVVEGAFYGQPAAYGASMLEWLIGACGIGLAGLIMLLGMRLFPVLPGSE